MTYSTRLSTKAESDLKLLKKFVHMVVTDSVFDLTGAAVLSYCFGGPRRVKDVVEVAVADSSLVGDVRKQLSDVQKYLSLKSLELFEKKAAAGGLDRTEIQFLSDLMLLFWEVYRTRSLTSAWNITDLEEMRATMDMMRVSVIKDPMSLSLHPKMRAYIHTGSRPTTPNKSTTVSSAFAREDGVFTAASFARAKETPVVSEGEKIILDFEKVLSTPTYSTDDVLQLCSKPLPNGFELTDYRAEKTITVIEGMFDRFRGLGDRRPVRCAMKVLWRIFDLGSDVTKESLAVTVMKARVREAVDHHQIVPVAEQIDNYEHMVIQCVNGLGDHNSLATDKHRFNQIRLKLALLLALVPYQTIERLLSQCVEDRKIMTAVLTILKTVSEIRYLTVLTENVTTPTPLIIQVITKIVEKEMNVTQTTSSSLRYGFENSARRDDFVYVVTALARRKRAVTKMTGNNGEKVEHVTDTVVDEAFVDSADLFQYVITPFLFPSGKANDPRPEQLRQMMISVLSRLVSSLGAKDTELHWSVDGGDWRGRGEVPAVDLVNLLLSSFSKYEGQNQALADACKSAIKYLGKKLRLDGVEFPSIAREHLLRKMNQSPWFLAYALSEWLDGPLGRPPKPLPAGLFIALPISIQLYHKKVSHDKEVSSVADMMRSLFELALFDCDLALGLMNQGLMLKPADEGLMEQMALSLVDVYGRAFMGSVSTIDPFIQRIIDVLCPSMNISAVQTLSECSFEALKRIRHLMLIAEATKFAFQKHAMEPVKNCRSVETANINQVPEASTVCMRLLDAFCERTKAHVDLKIQEVRRAAKERARDQIQPSSVRTEDRTVSHEMYFLFDEACCLTGVVDSQKEHKSLHILINCLCEYNLEMMCLVSSHRNLDDVMLKAQADSVYVYAQPPGNKVSPPVHRSSEPTSEETKLPTKILTRTIGTGPDHPEHWTRRYERDSRNYEYEMRSHEREMTSSTRHIRSPEHHMKRPDCDRDPESNIRHREWDGRNINGYMRSSDYDVRSHNRHVRSPDRDTRSNHRHMRSGPDCTTRINNSHVRSLDRDVKRAGRDTLCPEREERTSHSNTGCERTPATSGTVQSADVLSNFGPTSIKFGMVFQNETCLPEQCASSESQNIQVRSSSQAHSSRSDVPTRGRRRRSGANGTNMMPFYDNTSDATMSKSLHTLVEAPSMGVEAQRQHSEQNKYINNAAMNNDWNRECLQILVPNFPPPQIFEHAPTQSVRHAAPISSHTQSTGDEPVAFYGAPPVFLNKKTDKHAQSSSAVSVDHIKDKPLCVVSETNIKSSEEEHRSDSQILEQRLAVDRTNEYQAQLLDLDRTRMDLMIKLQHSNNYPPGNSNQNLGTMKLGGITEYPMHVSMPPPYLNPGMMTAYQNQRGMSRNRRGRGNGYNKPSANDGSHNQRRSIRHLWPYSVTRVAGQANSASAVRANIRNTLAAIAQPETREALERKMKDADKPPPAVTPPPQHQPAVLKQSNTANTSSDTSATNASKKKKKANKKRR